MCDPLESVSRRKTKDLMIQQNSSLRNIAPKTLDVLCSVETFIEKNNTFYVITNMSNTTKPNVKVPFNKSS